jgi:hypothetical protein
MLVARSADGLAAVADSGEVATSAIATSAGTKIVAFGRTVRTREDGMVYLQTLVTDANSARSPNGVSLKPQTGGQQRLAHAADPMFFGPVRRSARSLALRHQRGGSRVWVAIREPRPVLIA